MRMKNAENRSQEKNREFLDSSHGIEFAWDGREEVYGWIGHLAVAQESARENREGTGG